MNINYKNSLSFTVTSLMISAAVINLSVSTIAQANTQAKVVDKSLQSTSSFAQVSTDAKSVLMAKLAHLDYFSADFSQKVVSDSGEVLEQSSGKLAISKPNLASWHTLSPDELAIVSDGQDVWFYNPWIEQVSVYALSAAIAKTPILLLTSKEESLWEQYTVIKTIATETDKNTDKDSDRFVISAKDVNSQIKSLTLVFDSSSDNSDGKLKQFSFLDATGQLSHIKLTNFDDKNTPQASLFKFVVPDDVQIDDQRAN